MAHSASVRKLRTTAGTLTFAAACTILWVAALLWLALAARRFKADAEDGTLDVRGDRLVLRHSRKVWSVAGKPAPWRLRGAPTQ
jgi:ABC-type transport system involved in cytochrome c biogenesis permease component